MKMFQGYTLTATCSECDYSFNAENANVHIGHKFLLFDYGYIICPRCWHKIIIPREYEEYFGLTRGDDSYDE